MTHRTALTSLPWQALTLAASALLLQACGGGGGGDAGDTTAPNAPAITSVTDNVGAITGALASGGSTDAAALAVRVSLTGTNAVANDTAQLYDGSTALGTAATLTAVDISAGYVDITTSTLSNGTAYALNARLTDAAGNASGASTSFGLTVDTTAPGTPAILSVTDDVGAVTGALAAGGNTDETNPVVRLSLTGTNAVANDTAQLYDGATALGTAATLTAADITAGYVDIAASTLSNGTTYALNARLTDVAGNASDASASFSLTVDTTAPVSTAPSVAAATPDRLSYGRLSTFTITGTNLATAVTFSATGCDGLAVLAGGSVTQQTVTCTPNQLLSVRLAASVGGSEVYASNALAVPKPRVTLTTTAGSIVVELEPGVVKATVDNFLAYSNAGFFNGTIFHRVIPGFVVQGGGFTSAANNTLTAQTGLRAAIALQSNQGLSNLRGTIAMARTNLPDTATSQFFFNTVDNTFLDYARPAAPGYAVFGRITSDLAVVDVMSTVATHTVGGNTDVPVTDIVLTTAAQTL